MNTSNPATALTYAVGDIHGQATLLRRLQKAIRRDAESHHRQICGARPRVVYLGDYIDRGPDSAAVLDLVLKPLHGFDSVPLRGNHEDMLKQALDPAAPDAASAFESWYFNGGDKTLESYGIETLPRGIAAMQSTVRDALPASHAAFLLRDEGSHARYEDENAHYVHAGFNPDLGLEDQVEADLLWIRDSFLHSDRDWGKPVVHGHTPQRWGADVRPNRINIDTKAFKSGNLTAAVLSPTEPVRFLVASSPSPAVVIAVKTLPPLGWIRWAAARAINAQAIAIATATMETAGTLRQALHAAGITGEILAVKDLIGYRSLSSLPIIAPNQHAYEIGQEAILTANNTSSPFLPRSY